MNKIKNLIGLRFGRLLVISLAEKKSNRGALHWLCLCDCKNHKLVSGDNLKRGNVKSCGCLRREQKFNKCNLLNIKFGRLTVLKEVAKTGISPRWECKCECGNFKHADSCELKRGHVQSCGCLRRETASERRKTNQIGSNNACYNPLLTDEDRISRRHVSGYKEWSYKVKEKFNFTCQFCGDKRGGNLISHHLYGYMKFKELRLVLDNGVCLCEICHKAFHDKYGNSGNTKEQFVEWMKNTKD